MHRYKIEGVGIDFEFLSDPTEIEWGMRFVSEHGFLVTKKFSITKNGHKVYIPPSIIKNCIITRMEVNEEEEMMRQALEQSADQVREEMGFGKSPENPTTDHEPVNVRHIEKDIYAFERKGMKNITNWKDHIRREAKMLGIVKTCSLCGGVAIYGDVCEECEQL